MYVPVKDGNTWAIFMVDGQGLEMFHSSGYATRQDAQEVCNNLNSK